MIDNNKGGTSIAGEPTGANGTSIAGGQSGANGTAIAGGQTGANGTAVAGGQSGAHGTAVADGGSDAAWSGSTMGNIPELPEYEIRGVKYKTIKPLGNPSGEGRVFLVQFGSKFYALKIYISAHEPERAVLDAVKKAGGGFFVLLHDHGTWSAPNGVGGLHYYELMDYLHFGSLADAQRLNDSNFKQVAMRMAFCIKQCHDRGFIHRDIKPENFLRTNESVNNFVVSDFGIARMIGAKSTIETDLGKTGRYASPEACFSQDNVRVEMGRPSDFYSMGMTLLAMSLGVKNFANICSDKELSNYKLRRSLPDEFESMLRLNDDNKALLHKLLEFDPDQRADFDMITRWFKGEKLAIGSAAEAATATTDFKVVFNETKNLIATSPEQLASMMMDNLEYAKPFVYRGVLNRALERTGRMALSLEIDAITQRDYPSRDDQDAGVYAVALKLDPSLPYIGLKGKKCYTAKEISDEVWENNVDYLFDLKKTNARLYAYMRIRGNDTLRSLPDSARPIVEASGIHGIYYLCKQLNPAMPYFSMIYGKALTDLKEIAADLWKNKKDYSKTLANPHHALYSYLAHLGPKGLNLADTFPDRIRRLGEHELYALCLELDEDTPFYGKQGKKCYDLKEIADELWEFFKDYKTELTSPSHPLWKYMLTWNDEGWAKIARTYPELIKQDSGIWAFDLVYRLDPTKPYVTKYIDDNKWHDQFSFNDIINNAYLHGLHEDSLKYFSKQDLITWLTCKTDPEDSKRGVLLEDLVKKAGNDAPNFGWYFIYSLDPTISLTLTRDQSKKDYVNSTTQLGVALNYEIVFGCIADIPKAQKYSMLSDLKDIKTFRGSRLYQFMKARKMGKYITGIESILDIDANKKMHPAAPYNHTLALWKIVQYFGCVPTYLDGDTHTAVDSKEEVERMTPSEKNRGAHNGLPEFCALFFHENINAKYSFEALTAYYNFLEKHIPSAYKVQEAKNKKQIITGTIQARDDVWYSLKRRRKVIMWACLIPMIISMLCLMYTSLNTTVTLENAFQAIGKVAGVICAIICGLAMLENGFIAAIFGGGLAYGVVYCLFIFFGSIGAWFIIFIVAIIAYVLLKKLFKFTDDTYIPDSDTYDKLIDQANIKIVCDAFGTADQVGINTDPTQVFVDSQILAQKQESYMKSTAWKIGLFTLITAVLAFVLWIQMTADDSDYISEYDMKQPYFTGKTLAGSYTGMFDGRTATMELETFNDANYDVKGKVVIQYSTPMELDVVGVLSGDASDKLTLYVNSSYSRADANQFFDCSVYTDTTMMVSMRGTYTNYHKGSRYQFTFNQEDELYDCGL